MKLRFLLPAILVAAGAVCAQVPSTFDDCDQLVLQQPDQEQGYRCYITLAGRTNGWDEAARRLDALAAVAPDNHLAMLALASVEARRGGTRAESLYIKSIDAFQARSNTAHQVTARLEYATFLGIRRRGAESGEQLQEAMSAAVASGDRVLAATVSMHLARTEYYQARYEAAEQRLLKVREILFREGDQYKQAMWLGVAGSVRWGMGILSTLNDPFEEAVARNNVALLAGRRYPLPYSEESRATMIRLVEAARSAAVRGGKRAIEGKSELYMGQLVTGTDNIRDHLDRGLVICRSLGDTEDVLLASRLLAETLFRDEPRDLERGRELMEMAVAIAEQGGSPQDLARTRIVQATLHWELLRTGAVSPGDRETVVRLSLSALDAIEAIRDSQSGGTVRARTFSPWVFFYSRLIGNLLWPPEVQPSPDDTEQAFRIAERMRAQVFLEELDAADARRESGEMPWSGLPGIEEVQRRLQEDEAVLSFLMEDLLIKKYFSGGSWLTVITRDRVNVYSLPQKTELAALMDLTLGSIRNRDGSEQAGLERLYQDLLDEPLGNLPETVTHLIIVPDGPLHRLPFGALVEDRYRISQTPSVAAWLHWTAAEAESPGRPVSAWIDPAIEGGEGGNGERAVPLGRLPYAALEAAAARTHLGSGVQVRQGESATEQRFKHAALNEYAIVHVAAHAVVDDLHPDLSGIALAAGKGEDGLLQVREIVDLDLTGRTVILSACRSASGTTLEGEGVLSLARAFFVAGAQAVVANLWPVRDDEAAAFSADLYRYIGEGEDVASALALARRDRVDAGDSTEAWAGTVLFGNGRVRPFGGQAQEAPWSWLHLVFIAGILAVYAGFRGITLHRK